MAGRTPAESVATETRRWLELDDDLLPVMILAATVANRLPGPPVWLMVVAPPSSAKSELIMALGPIEGVRALSRITEHTFASGKKRESNDPKHLSLLDQMAANGQWLLAIKDFGTIQSLGRDMRNGIFGDLREIYDGAFNAAFGTGITVNWEGKLGLVVGATPSVDRLHKWSAELGERFVQFRPSPPDRMRTALKAVAAVSQDRVRKAALGAAYKEAFAHACRGIQQASLPGPLRLMCAQLADFVAGARTPVHRSSSSYDTSYQIGEAEGPARLAKVLTQIALGALLCYDGEEDAVVRLVTRVAVDSIPGNRRLALMGACPCERRSDGSWTGLNARLRSEYHDSGA
jgi:hypothetical protein